MTFKRRLLQASIWFVVPWGLFGLSYLFLHFAVPKNPYELIFENFLNYLGVLPFEVNLINISALVFAIALGYAMFLGLYFSIDKITGWEHKKWLR